VKWAGSRDKIFSPSGQGRTFFLTSLFIELIDPVVGLITCYVNSLCLAGGSLFGHCGQWRIVRSVPEFPLLTRVPGGEIRGKTESARIAFHQIGIHQNIANPGGGGRPS
jgi:hypothetical protein